GNCRIGFRDGRFERGRAIERGAGHRAARRLSTGVSDWSAFLLSLEGSVGATAWAQTRCGSLIRARTPSGTPPWHGQRGEPSRATSCRDPLKKLRLAKCPLTLGTYRSSASRWRRERALNRGVLISTCDLRFARRVTDNPRAAGI